MIPDELAQKGRVQEWLAAGKVDFPHPGFREQLDSPFGVFFGEFL